VNELFYSNKKAYENYLSDMMKQTLLEQLRMQRTFIAIQWRNDILNYFVKFLLLLFVIN